MAERHEAEAAYRMSAESTMRGGRRGPLPTMSNPQNVAAGKVEQLRMQKTMSTSLTTLWLSIAKTVGSASFRTTA